MLLLPLICQAMLHDWLVVSRGRKEQISLVVLRSSSIYTLTVFIFFTRLAVTGNKQQASFAAACGSKLGLFKAEPDACPHGEFFAGSGEIAVHATCAAGIARHLCCSELHPEIVSQKSSLSEARKHNGTLAEPGDMASPLRSERTLRKKLFSDDSPIPKQAWAAQVGLWLFRCLSLYSLRFREFDKESEPQNLEA